MTILAIAPKQITIFIRINLCNHRRDNSWRCEPIKHAENAIEWCQCHNPVPLVFFFRRLPQLTQSPADKKLIIPSNCAPFLFGWVPFWISLAQMSACMPVRPFVRHLWDVSQAWLGTSIRRSRFACHFGKVASKRVSSKWVNWFEPMLTSNLCPANLHGKAKWTVSN